MGVAFRRRRSNQQSVDSAATLKSVVEVAAVKSQVQALVRKLLSTLDELEVEIGRLPDDDDDGSGDNAGA